MAQALLIPYLISSPNGPETIRATDIFEAFRYVREKYPSLIAFSIHENGSFRILKENQEAILAHISGGKVHFQVVRAPSNDLKLAAHKIFGMIPKESVVLFVMDGQYLFCGRKAAP